ncbi:MAG: VWA domain-containing protein [Chitinophagaceae bacterium]|nr:VWA domain-containing protein [Chitinophagaceae bacterium]
MPVIFEHTEWFVLFLLLLPVISIWYWWEWRKKGILKKMVNQPRLLKTLISNYRPLFEKLRLVFFCLAITGLIIAIMQPGLVDEKANVPVEGVQVLIALDVSNSMLATDIAPNRLEKARMFAIRFAEKFSGSRIGLLAFAGEARLQMPPTTDLTAIKQALQTVGPASVPLQGTNLEAALTEGYNTLASDALKQKSIILITDGEELDGNAREVARNLGRSGLVINVLSVGTEEGGLLSDPETGLPILDENEQQVVSIPNNQLISGLAEMTGGVSLRLENTDAALEAISLRLQKLEKDPMPNGDLINYYSLVPWILLAVLLFLTFEWWQPVLFRRKISKTITTVMAVVYSIGGFGQNADQYLKNGLDAYKKGDYQTALGIFNRVLELDPANKEGLFYRGLSQYKLKNFADAFNEFNKSGQITEDPKVKSAAFNNAGLSLIEQKQLEQAVDLLKKALKAYPADEEIRRNLQKAILDLKKQQASEKKEEKQPEPPMDKDDANQKLQEVMEQERQAREKMKPKPTGVSNRKNW